MRGSGLYGSVSVSVETPNSHEAVEIPNRRILNGRSKSRSPPSPNEASAHSPHICLEILIPRRHRGDVPQYGGVQSDNVIQICNDKVREALPLVGKDFFSIRLDRTRVADELLAKGNHKLVLGNVARVCIEAARYELRIGGCSGIGDGLQELVEESWSV